MAKERPLIRFDWAIKKILRHKADYTILEGFISELLSKNIKIQKILESEGNKEDKEDKYNRVDLLVEDEAQNIFIVEVQNTTQQDYFQRLLYGTSKVITEHMKEGDSYKNVKKVYAIGIVYFDLGQGTDYLYRGKTTFTGKHVKDNLELSYEQRTIFNKRHVSDIHPEYYIIKVNQFNDIAKDTLDEWIYYLKNSEIKKEFKAKGLKEANEKLRTMEMSNEERSSYKRHLEDQHYWASMVFQHEYYQNMAKDTARKKIEIAREAEDTARKEIELEKKAGETEKKAEETAKKEIELAKKAEDTARKAEDTAKKAEDTARKAKDTAKKAKDTAKKEIELAKKAEETARKAEEAEKKAEDTAKKEIELAKKAEDTARKAEELARKAEETERKAEETERKAEEAEKKAEIQRGKLIDAARMLLRSGILIQEIQSQLQLTNKEVRKLQKENL